MTPSYAKPSVPLAVSTSSVIWSVALSALVREIIQSNATSLKYWSLDIPKEKVVVILVLLLAFFTLVFVRWLGRIQYWSGETSLDEVLSKRTFLLLVIMIAITNVIWIVTDGFSLPIEWGRYAVWAFWTWAMLPLLVALTPDNWWLG